MSERRRARVLVRGRVQGIGFRATASSRARSLGVGGWIRNNPDGSVEAELEGAPERLDLAIEWFRRGPSGGRVDDVRVEWEEPLGEDVFMIR